MTTDLQPLIKLAAERTSVRGPVLTLQITERSATGGGSEIPSRLVSSSKSLEFVEGFFFVRARKK